MAEEETKAVIAEAPKAGGGKILPILMVLNLGVSGFAAMQAMSAVTAVKHLPAAGAKAGESESAGPKPLAVMEPFVVNLKEEGRARYLKAKFDLELANPGIAAQLDTHKAAIRDDLLRYLSGLAVADTLGEEAKTVIGNAIKNRIDKQLGGDGKIHRIFFNEFVVQ